MILFGIFLIYVSCHESFAQRISTVAGVYAVLEDRHSCQIHSAPTRCDLGAFAGEGQVLFPTQTRDSIGDWQACDLAHAFPCFPSPFLPLSLVSTPLAGAELISTPSKDMSWVEQHFVDANLNNIEQYH